MDISKGDIHLFGPWDFFPEGRRARADLLQARLLLGFWVPSKYGMVILLRITIPYHTGPRFLPDLL